MIKQLSTYVMEGEQNYSGTTMILRLRIRRHVMTIEFRELGKKKV